MKTPTTAAALLALLPAIAEAHDHRTEFDHEPASAEDRRPTFSDVSEVDGHTPVPDLPAGEAAQARPVAYEPREEMTLAFIFHVDEGLAEQDVFFEREPGSGEVYRPTGATRQLDAPLYAPAEPVAHSPLQTENVGPWAAGEPLGFTLGEWFAAEGSATYSCEDGEGRLDARFANLVPNGLYTMWHDFAVWPPTDPFPGFYDLPFGARDGSENAFRAEADGSAAFEAVIKPCLQLSGEQLISELAIAYHSDDQTHGATPGTFSTDTHVQLYVTLPKRTGL